MNDKLLMAREAQKQWRLLSVKERLQCIRRLRKTIVAEAHEWINVFADETKKTPVDTLATECFVVANACKFYERRAASMLAVKRMSTPIEFFGQTSYVRYEPMGVVAIISPWNFPLQLSLIPLISAVIAGNAVILKPSEHTPRINRKIEDLLGRCGFPDNLIQIMHGAGDVGEQLIDAKPDKVFFTGGSFVGQKVYERAARHMIPCDLELGGNDAMIVCHDANLERAARAAVWGGFLHSGQVCISVERVYVEEPLYEAFVERVVELTSHLRQGLSTSHDLGGMTTSTGFQKVRTALKEAVAQGANIRIGTHPDQLTEPFFPPTVLTDVDDQMSIINEETFGPVLCIVPVRDEQDAIERTNASRYGLNSYIFTRDLKKAQTIAAALETGNCYINDVITNIGNMHLPFGGVKASGIGRYHGAEGLYTFCHTKSVMVDKGKSANKFTWFPYNERRFQMFQKLLKWLYGR